MENKKFFFHIHLPKGIEKIGQPIVLGDGKELGVWEKPIVKLHRPFPENPTYWQSEQVTISTSNRNYIQFKFAIHVPEPESHEGEEKFIFEGYGDKDNRILNIERENQFAIWKNNFDLLNENIQEYVFVDYIFNSIGAYNLNDKIREYQHLLSLY